MLSKKRRERKENPVAAFGSWAVPVCLLGGDGHFKGRLSVLQGVGTDVSEGNSGARSLQALGAHHPHLTPASRYSGERVGITLCVSCVPFNLCFKFWYFPFRGYQQDNLNFT